MAITKDDLKPYEDKHGDDGVAHVKCARTNDDGSPKWECAFRRPTRAEWKAYKRSIHNPAEIATAQEDIAIKCVLIPARADFDALLDRWPAIPESAAKAFDALLGLEVEASGKG